MKRSTRRPASWGGTAFMIEALVLLAALIACMAVLTQLFTHALATSQDGERTAQAIAVAQCAAEEFSADPAAVYAGKPVGEGVAATGRDGFDVACDVERTTQEAGTMYAARITVSDGAGEAYELEAKRYVSGVR